VFHLLRSERWARALLHHLPQKARSTDVSISRCLRVHPRFHARYHAKARTYFYRIHTAHNPPSVFEQDRMWHCKLKPPQFLDFERMKVCCCSSLDGYSRRNAETSPYLIFFLNVVTSQHSAPFLSSSLKCMT